MATAPSLPDRLAALPDEEIMRLHAAMRITRDTRRWAEIAATFPPIDPDTWRNVGPGQYLPPDTAAILAWREHVIATVQREGICREAIVGWYREDRAVEFINHWGITYDPRSAMRKGATSHPPLLLFKRQRELVEFLMALLRQEEHALIEKSRDMGATWVCCLFSIWLWITSTAAVGWGSRKEELVDRIGDPDSIFEKIRMALYALPPFLIPPGLSPQDHLVFMKCINPETGATITGECGDNIGRGGRKLIYFKDESAHYPRPELIEASLGNNTNVQVDFSSVNGLGNVFHRRREAGQVWFPGAPLVSGRANVLVMDWRDHPGKDEVWYQTGRQKAVAEGLLHKFRQENDRDYAASMEGIIILPEWIEAAVDAHIHLDLDDALGPWSAGLDVSDGETGDGNGLAAFEGIVLRVADQWADRDAGVATRRTLDNLADIPCDLQFDSIGVGASVKAEANRLADEGKMPGGIRMIPWNASAKVLDSDEPVIPHDRDSPTNGAMFGNLKAQAWWRLARRFENTYRARMEGISYPTHELVSIDSTIPLLAQVKKELAQPTAKKRLGDGKMIVDKKPEGTTSPNMGDATVMAANPLSGLRPVYPTAVPQFTVAPFAVPAFWPKGFAMKVEPGLTTALWGAYDREQKTLYIITEHSLARGSPSENAQAILARGEWVPGFIDSDETKLEDRRELAAVYHTLKVPVVLADRADEAGIATMRQLLATGRLKVFSTCQGFVRDYRAHRRDENGKLIGAGLMDCARVLCRPLTIQSMIVKPRMDAMGRRLAPGERSYTPVGDHKIGY